MYEYQKFDIVDVAERCGIKLNSRTLNRTEVDAWCPFCTTESTDYHMNLNRDKERFYCQKCGAGGNSITLYAKIHGIDNREAFKRISGGQYDLPPANAFKQKAQNFPGCELAALRQRHDVYYAMLELMGITAAHKKDLQERGLPLDRIAENMYRSMPAGVSERRRIAAELAKNHDLRGVPGFYYSGGRWELCGKPGILVPIVDAQGYIQGLQIRLDGARNRKYRWLSSNPEYGMPYGTASSVWVHVTGDRTSGEAFITEGGLKGDIASYLSGGRLFICTAGATSIRYLPEVLTTLGISKVYGCFDMDKVTELRAAMQRRSGFYGAQAEKPCPLERMESAVKSLGVSYSRCEWPAELNGIDDYYLAQLAESTKAA
jgi:hypothetical protein